METKQQFLITKAKNFRSYIDQFEPSADVKAYADSFKEENLIPTLIAVVVPIVKAGAVQSAVSDLLKQLNVPVDKKAEVSAKLVRYMEMFAEVVLS